MNTTRLKEFISLVEETLSKDTILHSIEIIDGKTIQCKCSLNGETWLHDFSN